MNVKRGLIVAADVYKFIVFIVDDIRYFEWLWGVIAGEVCIFNGTAFALRTSISKAKPHCHLVVGFIIKIYMRHLWFFAPGANLKEDGKFCFRYWNNTYLYNRCLEDTDIHNNSWPCSGRRNQRLLILQHVRRDNSRRRSLLLQRGHQSRALKTSLSRFVVDSYLSRTIFFLLARSVKKKFLQVSNWLSPVQKQLLQLLDCRYEIAIRCHILDITGDLARTSCWLLWFYVKFISISIFWAC